MAYNGKGGLTNMIIDIVIVAAIAGLVYKLVQRHKK